MPPIVDGESLPVSDTAPDPAGFRKFMHYLADKEPAGSVNRLLLSTKSERRTLRVEDWSRFVPLAEALASEENWLELRRRLVALPLAGDPRFRPYFEDDDDPIVTALWCAIHAGADAPDYLRRLHITGPELIEELLARYPHLRAHVPAQSGSR
jgi:hypothetical protein